MTPTQAAALISNLHTVGVELFCIVLVLAALVGAIAFKK